MSEPPEAGTTHAADDVAAGSTATSQRRLPIRVLESRIPRDGRAGACRAWIGDVSGYVT